jgi:hypothetical protein
LGRADLDGVNLEDLSFELPEVSDASDLEEIDPTALPPPSEATLIVTTIWKNETTWILASVKRGLANLPPVVAFVGLFRTQGAGRGETNGRKNIWVPFAATS